MVTSVVIAAHNEAAVIDRCLRRLLAEATPGEFEVIVVANGCTDQTAEVARAVPGVRVLELVEASKSAALNAGDQAATGLPRVYLDADIALSTTDLRALSRAVDDSALAAAPRRVLDTRGRPLLVKAYFAVNGRLPAFRNALFGRGAIVLSRAGRARFETFPDVIADDLFLDSLFTAAEKREVQAVASVVATPRRTSDLVRRLTRVRAGNAALRAGATDADVRPSRKASWLVDVVLPRPWLLPAGVCYVLLTLIADVRARRAGTAAGWGHDESSRRQVFP